MERAATAQTTIKGRAFYILLRADLDEREISISLYHKVLEAATLAADTPPELLWDFNEGDFEKAAFAAHQRLGFASPNNLNQMLADVGFPR